MEIKSCSPACHKRIEKLINEIFQQIKISCPFYPCSSIGCWKSLSYTNKKCKLDKWIKSIKESV